MKEIASKLKVFSLKSSTDIFNGIFGGKTTFDHVEIRTKDEPARAGSFEFIEDMEHLRKIGVGCIGEGVGQIRDRLAVDHAAGEAAMDHIVSLKAFSGERQHHAETRRSEAVEIVGSAESRNETERAFRKRKNGMRIDGADVGESDQRSSGSHSNAIRNDKEGLADVGNGADKFVNRAEIVCLFIRRTLVQFQKIGASRENRL